MQCRSRSVLSLVASAAITMAAGCSPETPAPGADVLDSDPTADASTRGPDTIALERARDAAAARGWMLANPEALSRVPTTTREPVRRKDTGHVDPSMRPRDEDYQRFIHLVDTYADCDWEPARQWAAAPFRMGCVQTTAILLKAGEDLLTVAEALALPEAAEELRAMTARSRAALLSRWSPGHRRFLIRDLIAEADVITPTQAGFLPLLALDLPADIRDAAVAEMRRWMQGLRVAFPTTPADCPAYEPRRYWRGPVWPVID